MSVNSSVPADIPADSSPGRPSSAGVQDGIATVLERITDAFIALDRDWHYTYVNQKAAEILRRRAQDLIGRHIWTEFPEDVGQPFYHACHEALAEQTPVQIQEYYAPYDLWFENRIYPSPDGVSIFFQDVTERRRGQERLQESERTLAEAQRIARLGSWEWNIQTGEVSWSQELLRMAGWRADGPAPTYANTWSFVHSDDFERVTEAVRVAVNKGGEIDFENRMVCPDGRELVVHNKGHLVRDVSGKPLRLIAVSQDVTEQRKTEAALQESQGHLQAIAEAIPASIVISRVSDSAVLYANPFARHLFGVGFDEDLSGYNATDFYQDPADRAETVRLLSLNPLVGPRELSVKRRDGTFIWAMGSFQRLTFRGEPAVLATHHDITERKQTEFAKEQHLVEAQDRADRDPLTGLLNHRAFYKRLEEETIRASREGTALAVVVLDMDNFKFFNDVYGHAVGDRVLRSVADRLKGLCRPYDAVSRFGGDEFALLLGGIGSASNREIETRLRNGLSDLSFLPEHEIAAVPVTLSLGVALFPENSSERLEVVRIADERLLRAKTGTTVDSEAQGIRAAVQSKVTGFSLLDALVTAVDNKDRYTRKHSEDVMSYSLKLARELGLDEAEQRMTAISALLHDVGKIGVPDAVLRKPGRLTEQEFEAIRQHPRMGAVIVSAVPGLEKTLDAVRYHHERWDGGGYPDGLKGDECPLMARLLAVADAFSAMTTDRPYRRGMAHEEALSILQAGAGTQWDPDCVAAFTKAHETAL